MLDEEGLFSGLIWSGEVALEMGLVDGLGSAGYVAREIVGAEDFVDYTIKPHPLDSFVKQLGISVGEGVGRSLKLQSFYPSFQ